MSLVVKNTEKSTILKNTIHYLCCFVVSDVVVEVAVVRSLLLTQMELLQPSFGLQTVVQVVEDVEILLHPAKDAECGHCVLNAAQCGPLYYRGELSCAGCS